MIPYLKIHANRLLIRKAEEAFPAVRPDQNWLLQYEKKLSSLSAWVSPTIT